MSDLYFELASIAITNTKLYCNDKAGAKVRQISHLTDPLCFCIIFLCGRLAQLARAPRLHRGGHKFESCTAHFAFKNGKPFRVERLFFVGQHKLGGDKPRLTFLEAD